MGRLLSLASLFAICAMPAFAGDAVDYTRDVKPILSDKCYACHGPDSAKRKAKLRLDLREIAVQTAIKPGHAAGSPLVQRIASHDPDEMMPPPGSKKAPLTPAQVQTLRRWIEQGAKFDRHWAYIAPVRPQPPKAGVGWARNSIDEFIAAEHARHGLTPAVEADRVTLARRLSFDLVGLPPKPEVVDSFVNDPAPDAYEKLVAKLLGSEHFGERMAVWWLDLVRYADTAGYHSDNHRDVALYRDYVINAFNANKPFDRFTVEQLAGDLLPNPTTEQRIASGYNRLLQTTEEGGAQPKEYAAKYAADRVRNASAVWLGATMGCCECHDHKFDPYSTRDFYSFAAFFADVQEKPVGRQDQTLLPTAEQAAALAKLDASLAEIKSTLDKSTPELEAAQAKWEAELKALKEKPKLPPPAAEALAIEPAKRTAAQKQALAAHFRQTAALLEPARRQLAATQKQRDELAKTIPTTLVSTAGAPRIMRVLPRGNWLDDSGEIVLPDVPGFFAERMKPRDPKSPRATRLDLARWLTAADHPLTARVLVNRLWKIAFGQGLVKSLDDFGSQGAPPTHPELLDWLATELIRGGWDVKHVLTLIVTSATYRQSSKLGTRSAERGVEGEPSSAPRSATRTPHADDPANLWLARQNRFRLDAEMVRDTALEVAGLLAEQVGGPSVKPAQPPGYWSFLNFPVREWQKDGDTRQYRRGLYTYWCRSFLHPALLAFDAPSREECTVDRARSSTPLQALVLLNDPNFVEAARVLAEKTIHAAGSDAERFAWAYRRALSRPPTPEETAVLAELLAKHRKEFAADRDAAQKLVKVGDWPARTDVDVAELAAWTSLCRVMLNLHDTITRN